MLCIYCGNKRRPKGIQQLYKTADDECDALGRPSHAVRAVVSAVLC